MVYKIKKIIYNIIVKRIWTKGPEELRMKRYKVVYEGYIFEGDSDGLNVRYAERYTDVSWMLNAYDGVEIIDTYYNI